MAERDRRSRASVLRSRLPESHRQSWSRSYANTRYDQLPWYSPRPSPWLVDAVKDHWIPLRSKVLDVGCGAGSNVLWLGRKGFRTTGVDIAPGAIAAASARAKAAGVDATFRVADVLSLPFGRSTFDVALDAGCFHTLPLRLRTAYADEIARVLRSDGTLLLAWIGREDTREWGPPHRPSLAEVATVFEPRFVFAATVFHARGSRRAWHGSGGSWARYTARLVRRRGPQPPPR